MNPGQRTLPILILHTALYPRSIAHSLSENAIHGKIPLIYNTNDLTAVVLLSRHLHKVGSMMITILQTRRPRLHARGHGTLIMTEWHNNNGKNREVKHLLLLQKSEFLSDQVKLDLPTPLTSSRRGPSQHVERGPVHLPLPSTSKETGVRRATEAAVGTATG